MYKHPGVYIEHVPSNMLSIEAASTSVTAFVGYTTRGNAVTATGGTPIFVTSVGAYELAFGPIGGGAGGITNEGDEFDAFGHSVNAFFANGGTKAYIVPVGNSGGAPVSSKCTVEATEKDDEGAFAKYEVTFKATSPGEWADDLQVRLDRKETNEFTLTIGIQTSVSLAENDLAAKEPPSALETFTGLDLDEKSGRSIKGLVNGASTLIEVVEVKLLEGGVAGDAVGSNGVLADGVDLGSKPVNTDFATAFERLEDYRDISILVLPKSNWEDDKLILQEAITHAEKTQNRMVIVDPGPDAVLSTAVSVKKAGFSTSPYAALYYPYLKVGNPHYHSETAANLPATFDIAPSGMAAGLWGRIDGTRGVWKAPAGLEATVRGALGPTVLIGNAIQDNLNEWGVNCLRSIIGPTVAWGARTLATKSNPQYRYIPVRRTQNMIGESLYNALQAVVFEPNDHRLWGSLRASVGNFMDGLHRAGAFQGEKASDAYYVQCGLGSTMTQGDIDAGIVRLVVGFAPLKPAEFVVVQIQQIVGQTA